MRKQTVAEQTASSTKRCECLEKERSSIVRIGFNQGCCAVGAQRALIGKHISRHKANRASSSFPAVAPSKNAPNTVMVARRDAGRENACSVRSGKNHERAIPLANKNSTESIFAPRTKHSKRSRSNLNDTVNV